MIWSYIQYVDYSNIICFTILKMCTPKSLKTSSTIFKTQNNISELWHNVYINCNMFFYVFQLPISME